MSAVLEFAERIADYVETANTYASWDKRRAMVEAVRVACEEARDDLLRAIERQQVYPKPLAVAMADEGWSPAQIGAAMDAASAYAPDRFTDA